MAIDNARSKIVRSFWNKRSAWGRHQRCTAGIASAILLGFPLASFGTSGGDTAPVPVRVEEDWELDLNEPEREVCSPQFHTVMSPYGTLNALYFQVTWNYRELPDVAEGGLQLQVWGGQDSFASRDAGEGFLSHDAETVTWTSVLSTDSSHVTYSIENGFSTSWGSFGGEAMRVRTARPLSSLSGYSTDVTAANSWITFGSNRVNRLRIKEIRTYAGDGTLLSRNVSERVIYQYSDSENPAQ